MARSRNIKPGFFDNDLLAEVPPLGRLLFIAMWTLADRDGKLEDRPAKIKKQALGYDECDIEALLGALASRGFILRYTVAGMGFIKVTNWHKHQQPHVKEVASTIPEPLEQGASTVQAPDKPGTSTEQESLIPDSLNLIPSSLIPEEVLPLQPTASAVPLVPKKAKKERKVVTTHLKPESVKPFQAVWDTPPKAFRFWSKETKDWADKPVHKGSRLEAEGNFQKIVDSGAASAPDLYYAFFAYITEGSGPKDGFFQAVSTFYGPEKATWLEWLDRGRALAREAS